jgi:steroid delta-isomerase-like uncharacterized protein
MTTTARHGRGSGDDPGAGMPHEQMSELVARHLAAEQAGDIDAAIAVYTADVQHDVVGWPTGPVTGGEGARDFYDVLTANFRTTGIAVNYEYFGPDFYVIEHQYAATVPGEFMGVPGNGKPVDFRMLHVFEFSDGLISRENVWLDGATLMAQLTA